MWGTGLALGHVGLCLKSILIGVTEGLGIRIVGGT